MSQKHRRRSKRQQNTTDRNVQSSSQPSVSQHPSLSLTESIECSEYSVRYTVEQPIVAGKIPFGAHRPGAARGRFPPRIFAPGSGALHPAGVWRAPYVAIRVKRPFSDRRGFPSAVESLYFIEITQGRRFSPSFPKNLLRNMQSRRKPKNCSFCACRGGGVAVYRRHNRSAGWTDRSQGHRFQSPASVNTSW